MTGSQQKDWLLYGVRQLEEASSFERIAAVMTLKASSLRREGLHCIHESLRQSPLSHLQPHVLQLVGGISVETTSIVGDVVDERDVHRTYVQEVLAASREKPTHAMFMMATQVLRAYAAQTTIVKAGSACGTTDPLFDPDDPEYEAGAHPAPRPADTDLHIKKLVEHAVREGDPRPPEKRRRVEAVPVPAASGSTPTVFPLDTAPGTPAIACVDLTSNTPERPARGGPVPTRATVTTVPSRSMTSLPQSGRASPVGSLSATSVASEESFLSGEAIPHPTLHRFLPTWVGCGFTHLESKDSRAVDCAITYVIPPIPLFIKPYRKKGVPGKVYTCVFPECPFGEASNLNVIEGHVRIAHLRVALGCPACTHLPWRDVASWAKHLKEKHQLAACKDGEGWPLFGLSIRYPLPQKSK